MKNCSLYTKIVLVYLWLYSKIKYIHNLPVCQEDFQQAAYSLVYISDVILLKILPYSRPKLILSPSRA